MSSYVTEHANSSRNSRVLAQPRKEYNLSVVADLPAPPESVLVSPSGSHVILVASDHLDAWSGGQMKPAFAQQPSGSRGVPVVTDTGVRLGLLHTTWSGEESRPHMSAMDERAYEIAAWVGPGVDISVAQNLGTLQSPFRMSVQAKLTGPGDTASRWAYSTPGLGTAAVLPDGRVAVASRAGKLSLLTATGDHATGRAVPIFEVETGLPIYALSFTEAGLVALFSEGTVQEAESLGRPPPGRIASGQWTSGIACYNAAGAEMWRAHVPFGASGPAVDAAGGRVIVAGRGIAAIEGGRVVWQSPTDVVAMATSFGEGSLAIAVGSELRVIGRAGNLIARLASPPEGSAQPPGVPVGTNSGLAPNEPGPPFVTPPAVAADGSIWIATATRLFVAR